MEGACGKRTLPVALRLWTVLLASTLSPKPRCPRYGRTTEVEEVAAVSIIVPRTQEVEMGVPGWAGPGLGGLDDLK